MHYELCSNLNILSRLGIPGAENILIPDKIQIEHPKPH